VARRGLRWETHGPKGKTEVRRQKSEEDPTGPEIQALYCWAKAYMRVRGHIVRCSVAAIVSCIAPGGWALDPQRSLTQYSRTVWTQADGLPQDTVRAITQTADGYLWLGTEEGLARFDGYEFTTFDKRDGDLPSNYITALAATSDGGLWIGTGSGLTEYRDKRFRTFTTRDGLPDDAIVGLYADHGGALWIVAGKWLSRFENGRFTHYAPDQRQLPVTAARAVVEDRRHQLWVGGMNGVGRFSAQGFTLAIGEAQLAGRFVTCLAAGADGTVWIHYTPHEPDRFVSAAKLLDGKVDPDLIKSNIVLVGTTAEGLKEFRPTPLDPAEAGVEIHAQLIEQLLLGDNVSRPDWARGAEVLFMLWIGLGLLLLLPRAGARWTGLIAIAAIAPVVAGCWYAYAQYNWLIDPVFPSLVGLLVYLSSSAVLLLRTETERRQVRHAFGR